ncbi:phosphonate metabolism transcriptional regulator PhnF [Ancylobacter sp. VNQ12]|uniref:phosphonate metabolism transcriptional regulator PhnF n=1 Tax=Ancylobacter sp. VNQ12 TaxID=3400920 RepID=UPI003C0A2D1E
MNRSVRPPSGRSGDVSGFDGLVFRPRTDTPIWQQIYAYILALIDSGCLQAGSQLPGEVHLAEKLGVTRITLRRALQQLQQEGHLTSRKGVGVFVRSLPSALIVRDGSRFAESLRADGKNVSTQTLFLDREPADAEMAAQLRSPVGSPVIRLRRVRSADGQPIYISTKVFPADRLADFEVVYARRQSVTDAFVAHGIQKYRRVETRISGGFATAEEAHLLQLTPGTPVFRTSSINADASGNRIEWARGCWLLTSVDFVF